MPLDDALCDRTRQLLLDLRKMAATGHIPPPLVDSPKCPRCSLVGICLPDETHLLGSDNTSTTVTPVRPLVARRHETRPLYVQEQGARIGLSGDELQVKQGWGKKPDVVATARLPDLSHVAVFGNVQISTQAINRLMREQIPIAYFSYGGWFSGLTTGLPSKNIDLRRCQFSRAEDTKLCLSLARSIVRGKIENQRTLLRRNHPDPPAGALADLKDATESAMRATSLAELLGVEGNAARVYFAHFQSMLKPHTEGHGNPPFVFDFERRTRRPPADPVNALLSYVYSLLVRDLTIICWIVGFDPYLGYFHQPRYGRPALALDLMEEFRPIVGDSVVITLINNGEVSAGHFLQRSAAVTLTGDGRKKVLRAYERRMETEITHPLFGYKVTYRRAFEVQTRILGRVLLGEIAQYPPLTTR